MLPPSPLLRFLPFSLINPRSIRHLLGHPAFSSIQYPQEPAQYTAALHILSSASPRTTQPQQDTPPSAVCTSLPCHPWHPTAHSHACTTPQPHLATSCRSYSLSRDLGGALPKVGVKQTDALYHKHHRVNEDIFSKALMVQLPDGHSAVMTRKDALKRAAELNLDLVEFKAPDHGATAGAFPVAKIVSYLQLRRERREARAWSSQKAKTPDESIPHQDAPASGAHSSSQTNAATEGVAAAAGGGQAGTVGTAAAGGAGGSQSRARLWSDRESQVTKGRESQVTKGREHQGSSITSSGSQDKQTKAMKIFPSSSASSSKKSKEAGKVKEVFFSPHIAPHDMQVKLRKIQKWLESGISVSVSQEVDSTGSTDAAERAIDGLIKQLANVGAPKPGKRAVRSNMATVVLQPLVQQQQKAQQHRGASDK